MSLFTFPIILFLTIFFVIKQVFYTFLKYFFFFFKYSCFLCVWFKSMSFLNRWCSFLWFCSSFEFLQSFPHSLRLIILYFWFICFIIISSFSHLFWCFLSLCNSNCFLEVVFKLHFYDFLHYSNIFSLKTDSCFSKCFFSWTN